MAGKSIDDILRQQAAQRQAQIQQQQAQERALNEQRERQRQDYLQRMRMFEALNTISSSAAAAAAGGRGKKPAINGHAELVLFKTSDLDNWQYVILDYLAETISDVKDTGIANTSNSNVYIIENTGFIIRFDNDTLFINDNAEIIESVPRATEYTTRNNKEYFFILFDDGSLKQFDGKKVNNYSGIPMGEDDTNTYLTKNSSLIIQTVDLNQDVNVYVWNPTVGVVNIWSGTNIEPSELRFNGIETYENSTFFTIGEFNDVDNNWTKINVYDENGVAKSYLDVTDIASLDSGEPTYFGDNKMEWKFTKAGAPWYFSIYDGDTDTWRTTSHARGTNYASDISLYQDQYSGSQYTSLSNGVVHILHDGSTQSSYNIDKYRHVDVVWSIDGSTHSSYTVNNTTTATKGVDHNDADRDGFNGTSLYVGKSIFLPMWLNDSKISLLCLTSTQSVVINAGTNTGLTGTQGGDDGSGNFLIPGWNEGQQYSVFRVGDYFGIWLAYASNDVYKIYNEFGANVISLTMSVSTRLNYTGDLAVVTDTDGIEYVFNANTLGLSPSYATYSTLGGISHYGLKPEYTDGDTTPSLILNLNEGGLSRIFTDEGVHEFTLPETTYNRWLSDEYIISEGRDGANYNLYFHDWTGTLLATIDTGIASGTSYNANLVKDRVYFRVVDGSTTTYYYFSPTKTDSFTVENETDSSVTYDYWVWFND